MKKTPKLRFKEFSGDWEENELGNILEISKTKYNPLKSAESYRCIELENLSQETGQLLGYFNSKEQQSIKNKFDKGQILFGKLRPYLKKYWLADFEGVCSSEIWVLSGKSVLNSFIYRIIQTDKFNLISNISSGSKMPRADWNYMREFPFFTPSIEEQEKIASLFSLIDDKISLQCDKVEVLKDYKRGIIQKIFNRDLRFKDDEGRDYPEWEEKTLNEVLIERKEKNTGDLNVCSVAVKKGVIDQIEHLGRSFAAKDTSNYNLVKYGDIIYTKSPTGDFPYGIIKQSFLNEDVVVSPLYGVFKPLNFNLGYILHCYFYYRENTNNYLYSIIQKGAKNTINITNTTFLSKSLTLPMNEDEQKKIASLLMELDNKIGKEQEKLDSLNEYKKGLLQQMFV